VPAVRVVAAIAAAIAIAASRLVRGPRARGGGTANPFSTMPGWLLPAIGVVAVLLIGLLVLRKLGQEGADDDGSPGEGDARGPERRRLAVLAAVLIALALGVAAVALTRASRPESPTTTAKPLPKD
jgi:hypothetical protein